MRTATLCAGVVVGLAACAGKPGDSAFDPDAPTLTITSPEDGASVPIGPLEVTFEVTNFPLVDPGEHTEFYDGYIIVQYTTQGYQMTETTSVLTDDINIADAGEHTISAELYTAEGDALDPAVQAAVTVTVTE